jgi:hypothetical protein
MKLEFSGQIFEKYSNVKYHENPLNGRRVVPYGRTDGRSDRLELANSTFRNFANPSKTGAQTCFKTLIQEYYCTLYVNTRIMLTEPNFLDDFR